MLVIPNFFLTPASGYQRYPLLENEYQPFKLMQDGGKQYMVSYQKRVEACALTARSLSELARAEANSLGC